jgi:hypothetical protein
MNLETATKLVELCPVPSCIQQLILTILLGYGTPSAHAIQTAPLIDEIPIQVVHVGTLNRCRHTIYYMEKTITHCYDNASHFSREALYEIHIIYLTNKQQTPYTILKLRDLTQYSSTLTRNRLIQWCKQETKIRANI